MPMVVGTANRARASAERAGELLRTADDRCAASQTPMPPFVSATSGIGAAPQSAMPAIPSQGHAAHEAVDQIFNGGPSAVIDRSGAGAAGDHREAFVASASALVADVTIESDPSSIADVWREMEAFSAFTPYQSVSFYLSWIKQVSPRNHEQPLLIVVKDHNLQLLMILPLVLRRRLLVGIASFAGGKHANYCMPVMRRDISIDKEFMDAVWVHISRLRRDIDVFIFNALPLAWDGIKNPLVNERSKMHPASSSILSLRDRPPRQHKPMSGRKRRKVTARDRHFSSFSPSFFSVRDEPARLHDVVAAFASQKADWARARRQPNAFAQVGIKDFLVEAMCELRSCMDLYWLEADGKILAIAGTATSCNRASLMFVSYDADTPAASCSPGLRLIKFVMSDAKRRGSDSFDFGLGEAEYKVRLQTDFEPVFVNYQPVTHCGLLVSYIINALRCLKIVVKSHRGIFAWVRLGQALLLRLHGSMRQSRTR